MREFTSNILIQITTPRLAVQYGNILSFSLPLLKGEVNIVDLMLIEAVKVFYPKHYEFIINFPSYFISSPNCSGVVELSKEFHKNFEDTFSNLNSELSLIKQQRIQDLMENLFPEFKNTQNNIRLEHYRSTYFKKLAEDKRISSTNYFNRYFSYVVLEGELSDVAFDNFIESISYLNIDDISKKIKELISNSSDKNFINKLRLNENNFKWEIGVKLAKSISYTIIDLFPKHDNIFFGQSASPYGQAAIFIYQIAKNQTDYNKQVKFAKELIEKSKYFHFSCELFAWFGKQRNFEDEIFKDTEQKELFLTLLNRAKKESVELPIFKKFPNESWNFFYSWSYWDKHSLNQYMEEIIQDSPNSVTDILNIFTPSVNYIGTQSGSYQSDFDKKKYNSFIQIFNKELIFETLITIYNEDIIDRETVKWRELSSTEEIQSPINIARQFIHWYSSEN